MQSTHINILHLTTSSQIGGAETLVIDISENINPKQFNIFVCALEKDGNLLEKVNHSATQTKHLNSKHLLDFMAALRLYRFIKENKIQLIQIHGLRANLIGRVIGRLAGTQKIISTIHGIDTWRKWYHTFLDRLTGIWVDKFISVSESGKEIFVRREKFPASKIVTIHNGIDLSLFNRVRFNTSKLKKELGLENNIIIGEVANIRSMKGHVDVIEAIPAVIEHYPNVKFLFVGRDDSKGKIPQLAQNKIGGDFVLFLGYQENIPELLSIFDIFILPSHSEGLPLSILEAMAMELPVIATNVGGIPEIIVNGETGILIEPHRPDKLAQALLELLANPQQRHNWGEMGRKRVEEEFSLNKMIQNVEELYLTLLHE